MAITAPAHTPGTRLGLSHDLFVESSESVSISWRDGVCAIRRGFRRGAGIRWLDGSRTLQFRSLDNPTPERISHILEASGPTSGWPDLDRLRQDSSWGWAEAHGPTWNDEIASCLAYMREAAACLAEELGEDSSRVFAAETHLFRQTIAHDAGQAEQCQFDNRGGVRVDLRVSSRDSRGAPVSVRQRVAATNYPDLSMREPPRDLGVDLGRRLQQRESSRARVDGVFPVLFTPRGSEAILHEIGHLFEEDHARRAAVPWRKGEKVASADVTLIDDPGVCVGRGSNAVDDEGVRPSPAILVDRGVVTDLIRARGLSGEGPSGPDHAPRDDREEDLATPSSSTGHGRRASYRDPPLARMACTYLARGTEDPEAILSDTPRGIQVRSLGSGWVDPDTARVTLVIAEGYLIEAGRVTRPLEESLIVATARDLLGSIETIGNDLTFDHGSGNCVKADQPLPVMIGLPTIRLGLVRVISP